MIRTHVFDLIIIALPFLRPLRALRGFQALRALAPLTALGRSIQGIRRAQSRRGLSAYGAVLVAVVFVGAGLVWRFEQDASNPNIDSYADALWWALVTCTTVGYGDFFPASSGGRAVAFVIMLVGIGGLSLVTANIAAYFVETDDDVSLTELKKQLERIEGLLTQRAIDS